MAGLTRRHRSGVFMTIPARFMANQYPSQTANVWDARHPWPNTDFIVADAEQHIASEKAIAKYYRDLDIASATEVLHDPALASIGVGYQALRHKQALKYIHQAEGKYQRKCRQLDKYLADFMAYLRGIGYLDKPQRHSVTYEEHVRDSMVYGR